MPPLWVRTLPDRLAFTAPSGGQLIPSERYISVPRSPWIMRLLTVHGDIEERPAVADVVSAPSPAPTLPPPASKVKAAATAPAAPAAAPAVPVTPITAVAATPQS